MNSKVSIIIPNHNASKYILRCIKSILNQSYENIEIIIVDDGSTDDSWEIIKKIAKENDNIIGIRQNNMNASIARNKGIELATGDYVLFLDSDDELFENAIEILVKEIETSNTELVLGNLARVDENDRIIKEVHFINKQELCLEPFKYIGTIPVPSNKLFNLNIIKNKNIYFGNVRIGQDLNFFLKYMIHCNKISLVDTYIYKWRVVKNSMTNSCNFRIFDIIEAFKDVKKYYINNGKEALYENYIKSVEYRHYYLQMEKQKNFNDRKERKLIVNFFQLQLKKINIKDTLLFQEYKNDYIKSILKLKLKFLYISKLYYYLDNKFSRKIKRKK